jgi:hypothetical protein
MDDAAPAPDTGRSSERAAAAAPPRGGPAPVVLPGMMPLVAEPPAAGPVVTVGWREWAALPAIGVPLVKVKVDTGARSSALHAFDMERFEREGLPWVRFTVHPFQGDVATTIRAECQLLGQRVVKSSGGQAETRPVVAADVELAGQRWEIELTLTNRDAMGFRMLLGRQAVRGRFVVDPSRSFVQGRRRPRGPLLFPELQ